MRLHNKLFSFSFIFFCTLNYLPIGSANASEVYKWTDESGKVHYSDKPKHKNAKVMQIIENQPTQAQIDQTKQQVQERNIRVNNLREEQYDMAQQKIKDKNKAIKLSNACKKVEKKLKLLRMKVRIFSLDDNGEKQYLTDEKRQNDINELESQIAKHCR